MTVGQGRLEDKSQFIWVIIVLGIGNAKTTVMNCSRVCLDEFRMTHFRDHFPSVL